MTFTFVKRAKGTFLCLNGWQSALEKLKQFVTSDYVIANQDGGPLSYTQFKRVWQYIVTRPTQERTYVRYINGQKITKTVAPVLGEKAGNNGRVVYIALIFR